MRPQRPSGIILASGQDANLEVDHPAGGRIGGYHQLNGNSRHLTAVSCPSPCLTSPPPPPRLKPWLTCLLLMH